MIHVQDRGVYPYEICLHTHPVEREWFPYMISDICCLHSLMFAAQTWLCGETSPLATIHYAKTLQLLQGQLDAFTEGSRISDATMMVVIMLITCAIMTEDISTAKKHLEGLAQMVQLRGGVRSLDISHNMQVKVCR